MTLKNWSNKKMKIQLTKKEIKFLSSLLTTNYHREVVEEKYKDIPQWTIFGKLIEAEKQINRSNKKCQN